ncbi:MAG: radical SAM protein [Acidobacteria bacterium]|nr:radical SAM protein [Acidobacteriota bacterium]
MTTRLRPGLPIFRLPQGASDVLYTPGYLALVTPGEADEVHSLLVGTGPASSPPLGRLAAELRRYAERAIGTWSRRLEAPFAPECLTVYLSNQCNLACPYCFSSVARQAGARGGHPAIIEEAMVHSTARLVARCCAEKMGPFHLVLHGGGEPTIHWDMVVRIVNATRAIADEAGVDWFGVIVTNGVVPETAASWMARHFNLVELSCDGPPEIQDRQRPLAGGGASSPYIEKTARTLREAGGRLTVRTTITPRTVERQAEIVAYLHETLGARQMRFEPVYRVRGGKQVAFQPDQAAWFVEHFLAAQREARARGCDLSWAGVRLDELHGPYCSILRDTLHLVPDGAATACFFYTGGRDSEGVPRPIGRWGSVAGEYMLDIERIGAHRRKAGEVPESCTDCLNILHCARECPEVCYATDAPEAQGAKTPAGVNRPGFRCLVNRRLAEAWIEEAAASGAPAWMCSATCRPTWTSTPKIRPRGPLL